MKDMTCNIRSYLTYLTELTSLRFPGSPEQQSGVGLSVLLNTTTLKMGFLVQGPWKEKDEP